MVCWPEKILALIEINWEKLNQKWIKSDLDQFLSKWFDYLNKSEQEINNNI